MRQEEWTVEAADAYLNEIPKFTSEKHTAEGLRRMLSYLNALPQEERIVHVAGTNGKGSVCSFLDAVLQKAGKRTARFTSPHLVRVTERFSFDGQEADDALFLEAFEAVKASYAHFEQEGLGHPTYFEYLFLMFMWMVRRKKPEYVILETGLGGRLDATNCIEHPALTVITSISLDHMEYLGGTVTQIAGEKAGILKKNMPVVYDDTDAAASAVIRNRAAELSCPAYPISPAKASVCLFPSKRNIRQSTPASLTRRRGFLQWTGRQRQRASGMRYGADAWRRSRTEFIWMALTMRAESVRLRARRQR